MGTEFVVAGIVGALIVFLFSLSVVFNVVFFILLVVGGLFLRNLLIQNDQITQEMTELDSQLILSDSINDIIEHIMLLREELFELTQMDMYTGEPTIQRLLEIVAMTLEKIETSVINQEYMRSLENND